MECYNPKKNEWTFKKQMHQCRDGACYVTDGILIYAISGYDGNNYLGSVEVYDPLLDKWTNGGITMSCFTFKFIFITSLSILIILKIKDCVIVGV